MTDFPYRTQRRHPGNARVTPRDVLILDLIAKAQPVSTPQIRRFLDASTAVARHRMRILRDLGLVQVHVSALHEVSRFTLTPKAKGELARALGRDPGEFKAVRGIGKVNLAHHEGVVDLHVALHVACAHSRTFTLVEWMFEKDIRALLGASLKTLVPDATAVVENYSSYKMAMAFEVDLANESLSYFVRHKVESYADLREVGHPLRKCDAWIVCCTVPSERRLNRLALAAWEAGIPEGLWYFAVAGSLNERNILQAVWKTPRVVDGQARLVDESPLQTMISNPDLRNHLQEEENSSKNIKLIGGRPGSLAQGDVR